MDMQMDVNATGDDVRISYPSFSNFEDLTLVLSGGELTRLRLAKLLLEKEKVHRDEFEALFTMEKSGESNESI